MKIHTQIFRVILLTNKKAKYKHGQNITAANSRPKQQRLVEWHSG